MSRTPGRSIIFSGWESQDDIGARAHFLLQPSERFSVLLSGDYLNSQGTGSRGIDFFNASVAGHTVDDFDDPRKVNMIGFSPVQDTDHWGASLNATYYTDFMNVQYIGGYRDLHFTASHSTGGRNIDFDQDERIFVQRDNVIPSTDPRADAYIAERYYGGYSALIWDTTSESNTHELRFTSPDDADRLTWALGLYRFKEDQSVFLGIPFDYNINLPYLEFNQGDTVGESKSAYTDMTFAVTPRLRVTAGARYSDESKERTGFNFIAGSRHERRRDPHQYAGLQDDRTAPHAHEPRREWGWRAQHARGHRRALPRGHRLLRRERHAR